MSDTWRKEALAVCRLLGDAASGRPFDVTQLPDESVLLGFSKVHRITTLVSCALRTVGADDTAYPTLHAVAAKAVFHQTKNDLLTARVLDRMTERGVTVQPLKGAAIRAVYPDGWLRTATDTDLFVKEDQLDAATAVLTEAGFAKASAHDGDFCFHKPPRSVVELHTTLGGFSKSQRKALARLSETPFTVNEHYVYTLFHLYKHFLYAGAGVRLFLDIYHLSNAVTDRERVERWLDELEISEFDRAVHTVCGILFDGDDEPARMTEAVDLVLRSGTFGTEDSYHAMKKVADKVTHTSRVHTWMTDRGFDLPAMTDRYPVLEKHRWLYPVCVVRRVVHGLLFKRAVLRRTVKAAHAADPHRIRRVLQAMNVL